MLGYISENILGAGDLLAGHRAAQERIASPGLNWLRDVAQVLPVRPLAVAMQAAFDPVTNGGRTFAWPDLGIVAAWGAVAAVFAARRFSWLPGQH